MFRHEFPRLHRNTVFFLLTLIFASLSLITVPGTRALFSRVNEPPQIAVQACAYDATQRRLVIRGSNFAVGATLTLVSPAGLIPYASVQIVAAHTIYVEGVNEAALQSGFTLTVTNPGSGSIATASFSAVPTVFSVPARRSGSPQLGAAREPVQAQLSQSEVEQIIAQAVAQAETNGLKAAITVVDAEGRALGLFIMDGAPATARIGLGTRCTPNGCASLPLQCGLEGACVPICAAALSKAVTGSFLSSQGHAFSTRTASFIVQEHFPPGVNFQPSGPLYGVQFSQLLCSDINPKAPLGLAAGAGGLPLYKNGIKVGGIGVEGDGRYAFDPLPSDLDVALEELAALAGTRGFTAPAEITADKIIVNGIRLPYVNVAMPPAVTTKPLSQLAGSLDTCLGLAPAATRASLPSEFKTEMLGDAPAGRINTRLFPLGASSFGSSPDLSQAEVVRILTQAAKQAFITRAAIRQPLNSAAEVNITVCDADGKILGIFSTLDAPQFGLDVSAQKARTAAFFSHPAAATRLQQAGQGRYVEAAARDGIRLDGSIAFSDRAVGFLSRPLYPDGIDRTLFGPFSLSQLDFSPFNVGLQVEVISESYVGNLLKFIATGDVVSGTDALTSPCGPAALVSIANGFQIFPGSVPLYKNGKLVGAVGVSGDGVDQDDLISAMGSAGFEAPIEIRTDRFNVRGTRLPYVKFPRHPNRD
jgi:uncharacterized protein GlcG (DUF336 family)